MAEPSPARLYATLVGGLLVVGGIVGFFYSSSFGSPGTVGEMPGGIAVNGWLNLLHILTGAVGLLVAGFAPRRYAMLVGIAYLGLACWGFALGDGEAILGFLPGNSGDDFAHLALGALGVGAALGTPRSESRAKRKPVNAPAKA